MPTGAPAATVAATAAASAATAAAAAATAAAAAAAPSAAADTSGTPAAPVSSGTPPATASSMPPLRSGSGERLAQQATTPLSGLSGRTMFIWALVLAGMVRTAPSAQLPTTLAAYACARACARAPPLSFPALALACAGLAPPRASTPRCFLPPCPPRLSTALHAHFAR